MNANERRSNRVSHGLNRDETQIEGNSLSSFVFHPRQSAAAFLPAWGAAAVAASIAAIFFVAPIERTMGAAQRIVYIHVPCAWLALAGFLIMAAAGAMHLRRRELAWDAWAEAAGELGWVFCSLTL